MPAFSVPIFCIFLLLTMPVFVWTAAAAHSFNSLGEGKNRRRKTDEKTNINKKVKKSRMPVFAGTAAGHPGN